MVNVYMRVNVMLQTKVSCMGYGGLWWICEETLVSKLMRLWFPVKLVSNQRLLFVESMELSAIVSSPKDVY